MPARKWEDQWEAARKAFTKATGQKNSRSNIDQMKVWRTGEPKFKDGEANAVLIERMAFLKSVQDVDKWLTTG